MTPPQGLFLGSRRQHYQATGEFRPPRKYEYYLSGAVIEAYQAPNDLSTSYWIAKPYRSPQLLGAHGRNAHTEEVKAMFGLSPKAKWPPEGLPERQLQGFWVWVTPAKPPVYDTRWGRTRLVKNSGHRVMARCPHCMAVMSAGRLHQHVCKP